MAIKIVNEFEFKKWFEKNFKKLGYSKIIKGDTGKFPDFVMERNNDKLNVELETLSSNFLLHNHDFNKVDEVICIKKDVSLPVRIIEISELEFKPRIRRISATIEKETKKILDNLLRNGSYRNKSHIIEEAIKLLKEKQE